MHHDAAGRPGRKIMNARVSVAKCCAGIHGHIKAAGVRGSVAYASASRVSWTAKTPVPHHVYLFDRGSSQSSSVGEGVRSDQASPVTMRDGRFACPRRMMIIRDAGHCAAGYLLPMPLDENVRSRAIDRWYALGRRKSEFFSCSDGFRAASNRIGSLFHID